VLSLYGSSNWAKLIIQRPGVESFLADSSGIAGRRAGFREYEKKEKCGLFGVWGTKDASQVCYQGLFALQHRGQESAGIA